MRRSQWSLRGQPSLQEEERTNIPSASPSSCHEGQDRQSQFLHRNNLPNLGKVSLTDPSPSFRLPLFSLERFVSQPSREPSLIEGAQGCHSITLNFRDRSKEVFYRP